MATSSVLHWCNYLVISRDPLIIVVSGPYEAMEHLPPVLAGRRAYLLVVFWWHQAADDRQALVQFFARRRTEEHEIIFLCNETELHESLRAHGFESELCHHNAFLDERLFAIHRGAPKRFDAVYNANCDGFKRHELAADLDNLAIITYPTHTAGADRIDLMRNAYPSWHWLNFDRNGRYSRLTPQEVCRRLNESRVGLCLSSYEGGMFASAEYLLCGVPIVSTRSVGGRTEFFDGDFVTIVDDDPRAVRDGVDEMIGRRVPPEAVRETTLRKIAAHRQRFVNVVQSIYDREGVRRAFAREWNAVFVNKMYRTQPCEHVLEDAGRTPVTAPSARFLRVRMDISSRCNLRCTMCHFAIPGFTMGAGDMSRELVERIAAEVLPLSAELYLSCSTEPMVSPHFTYLLELVARHHVPFTEFTTNATLLNEAAIHHILETRVASIVISIDGATRHTFERIRAGARFDQVIGNIRLLQESKRLVGTALPHVKFNWVLMRSNIEELPAYVELAHQLGVDTIGCVHLIANAQLHVEHELLNAHQDLANRYLDLARERAARLGITFFSPPNFTCALDRSAAAERAGRPELRPQQCSCPTSEIVIFPDGKVSPCGYWWSGYFGDLTRQSFADIWRGAEYRKLRESFRTGHLMKPCEVCPTSGRGHVDNPESFAVYGQP